MNALFKYVSLPVKLLIIGLIPLAFAINLGIGLYLEKDENLTILDSYINRIHQSVNLSRLIDNLQKERNYTFEFALNRTSRSEMLQVRPKTDSVLKELLQTHDSSLHKFPLYTNLDRLQSIRQMTDSGTLQTNQVIDYYSNMIFRLNTLNSVNLVNFPDLAEVYSQMAAQRLLSEIITYLGIINANIYNLFYTKRFVLETLLGTYGAFQIYKSYEEEYLTKAGSDAIRAYNDLKGKTSLGATTVYLDSVFKRYALDSTYNHRTWNEASSSGIDELRNLQMSMLSDVEKKINEVFADEEAGKRNMLILLIVISILALALVFFITREISHTLKELKLSAQKIAAGNTDIHLVIPSGDAVGSLAESITNISENNKKLAVAAQAIGKGDFSAPVEPRGSNDLLGNAVMQMRNSLRQFTQDIEHSREQFKQLADFMPQIVWTAQPNGVFDYYNKQWYEVTGMSDAAGQSWIPVLHPDDVGLCLATWYHSVETGEPYELEFRLKEVATGRYKWFLGRAVPVKGKDGVIVKWFGTCTDIHEQKVLRQHLEDLVEERTHELRQSNEDLQQFAHVASHDLKEPLRKIRTFGSRLSDEYSQHLSEKGKLYLSKIQESAARMTNMIDGVLNYSTINATNQKWDHVDLNMVIVGIRNDLELSIIQKDAKIISEKLPVVKGMPPLLYQLFYNLLNNALKFAKQDVSPVIQLGYRKVKGSDLEWFPNKDTSKEYHMIDVRDNGIGFDPSKSEKLFQIFTRLNSGYDGTGLGLALCKKIALRHHGDIVAEGREGEGAVFHVVLPMA